MTSVSMTSVISLDQRSEITAYPVDERLLGKVSAYWTLVVERPPAKVRVIPDGQIDLIFDLDQGEAYVAGPLETPFEVVHERPTHLLGMTLLPGAAAAFLGVPLVSLDAKWQPLARVLGEVSGQLVHQLSVMVSLPARIGLLETFVLARLGHVDARVTRALRAIDESSGNAPIVRIGRVSGASTRNLSRLFEEWVGLSPKRLARITRVQAALRRLHETPAPELATLAAELGFADHAHMTREVRAIAGAAPRDLAETFKRKSDSYKR